MAACTQPSREAGGSASNSRMRATSARGTCSSGAVKPLRVGSSSLQCAYSTKGGTA